MMQSGWVEIFFLAMLAGFIGLRLYHVLGRRTGHEKPVAETYRPTVSDLPPAGLRPGETDQLRLAELPADTPAELRPGLEAVMQADRTFAPDRFVEGARTAYQMVLEAFWRGDIGELSELVSDDLLDNFKAAIAQRRATGEQLDNRLLQVDRAIIVDAHLNGTMAELTVRFDSEILSVTRDAEGRIIAGDPNNSVETHDVWTFSRHTASPDPAWLLVATDEA